MQSFEEWKKQNIKYFNQHKMRYKDVNKKGNIIHTPSLNPYSKPIPFAKKIKPGAPGIILGLDTTYVEDL